MQNSQKREQDLNIIERISSITGINYSDEQMDIMSSEGGLCIISGAGSGKTTVLTHLIAKRTLSGEIRNPKKCLVCTYSKAGQEELENRLNSLLESLGCTVKYEVKTLHASYLNMLTKIGVKCKVATGSERTNAILEACKNVGIDIYSEEDKLQKIDSIISYQINNMLTDEALEKEYIFDISDGIEMYSKMSEEFRRIKKEKNIIDFDDMQMLIYSYMVAKESIRELFRSYYDYFFIDEFQDTSRIQFEILKMMLKDESKLVVIGDDDQCIVEGTQIATSDGYKNIEDIAVGTKVIAGSGYGATKGFVVDKVAKKKVNTKVVTIKTANGSTVTGTADHVGFAYNDSDATDSKTKAVFDMDFVLFGSKAINQNGTHMSEIVIDLDKNKYSELISTQLLGKGSGKVREVGNKLYIEASDEQAETIQKSMNKKMLNITHYNKYAALTNNVKYKFMKLGDMQVGMKIPVYNSLNKRVIDDEIIDISINKFNGYVYDISVPGARNFIAGNILVHNCIYQWRGADPNIILNICGYYDIKLYKLTTNYRCKSNIVDMAAKSIVNNQNRYDKELKAKNEGGEVEVSEFNSNDLYSQSKFVADKVKDLLYGGTEEKDIAILVRNNAYGCIIYDMMLSLGIVPRATEDIKFGKNKIITELMSTVGFINKKYDHNNISKNLWKYVRYMSAKNSEKFGNMMSDFACSFEQLLKSYLVNCGGYDIKDSVNEVKIPYEKFKLSLRYDSLCDLKDIYDILTDENASESDMVQRLIDRLIDRSSYRLKNPDTERLYHSCSRYIVDRVKDLGLDGFEEEFRKHGAMSNIVINTGDDRVTISTMHGVKGKEYKYVFILSDDCYCMPSKMYISNMIENGLDNKEVISYIEQERRLHYVAMTRAKDKLYIVTSENNNMKSPFLLEAQGMCDNLEAGESNRDIIAMSMM